MVETVETQSLSALRADLRQPSVTSTDFREAMALMGAAVNIITTASIDNRTGFTATAVCSVSDDPATLLFCVNNRSSSLQALLQNNLVCVNTLCANETAIAEVFSGRTKVARHERFSVGDWIVAANGCPVLRTALIAFECRVLEIKLLHTHHVFFATVTAVHHSAPRPALVYQNRAYKTV
jgi:flavin reductase